MNIEISQEEYEFLKSLKEELNTQDTDGCAQPVYWSVIEDTSVATPEGCGEPHIAYDGTILNLDDAIEYVEDNLCDYDESVQEKWLDVDSTSLEDIYDFMYNEMGLHLNGIVSMKDEQKISQTTGAFLTKKACKEYIGRFGYNHSNPKTYAMTAYRNFELEKLLNILKNLKFNEQNEK